MLSFGNQLILFTNSKNSIFTIETNAIKLIGNSKKPARKIYFLLLKRKKRESERELFKNCVWRHFSESNLKMSTKIKKLNKITTIALQMSLVPTACSSIKILLDR